MTLNLTPERHPQDLFPSSDSLCENCGYQLQGLKIDQTCPECGDPINNSTPSHRPGLPWQNKISVNTWWSTCAQMLIKPGKSFRRLKIGRSNFSDRIFLGTFVFGLAITVVLAFWWENLRRPWLWGVIVATGIPAATYIEILGVTFFSWKQGWRVPFELAERVACYASIGWVPAIFVLASAQWLAEWGLIERWWNPQWGMYTPWIDAILSVILLGISVFWFELLVWLGIRKVRFANKGE